MNVGGKNPAFLFASISTTFFATPYGDPLSFITCRWLEPIAVARLRYQVIIYRLGLYLTPKTRRRTHVFYASAGSFSPLAACYHR